MSADVVAVISGLVATAQLWNDHGTQTVAARKKAVLDLGKALRHTKMYIREIERKQNVRDHLSASQGRDWQIECALADMWHEASLSCKYLDRGISEMANVKSGFWEDVSKWSRADITRAGIAISEAEAKIRALEKRLG